MALAPPAIRMSLPPATSRALPQCALDSVVDEVERGAARALPGAANLVGQDEDRRMERGFLGPEALSAFEHPLAHDAHAGTLEGLLQDPVVLAGLAAFAELEVLAEEPLLETHLCSSFHWLSQSLKLGSSAWARSMPSGAMKPSRVIPTLKKTLPM